MNSDRSLDLDQTLQFLAEFIAKKNGVTTDSVCFDSDTDNFGLDSSDLVDIVVGLEKRFDLPSSSIDAGLVAEQNSLRQIAKVIVENYEVNNAKE